MDKVSYKELRSAVVVMSNEVDTTREYEISANVNVQAGGNVGSIDNGVVRAKDATEGNIATFSAYSNNGLNMRYDTDKRQSVLAAVEDFIEDCKAKVADGNVAELVK